MWPQPEWYHRQPQSRSPVSRQPITPEPVLSPMPYHVVTSSAVARTTLDVVAADRLFAGRGPTTPMVDDTRARWYELPESVPQPIVEAISRSSSSSSGGGSSGGGHMYGTNSMWYSAIRPYPNPGIGVSDAAASLQLSGSGDEVGVGDVTAEPLDLRCTGGKWVRGYTARRPHYYYNDRRSDGGPSPRPATEHHEGYGPPTKLFARDTVYGQSPRLSAGRVPPPATSRTPAGGRPLLKVRTDLLPFRGYGNDRDYVSDASADGERCSYDVSLGYGWSRDVLDLEAGTAAAAAAAATPFANRLVCMNCSSCFGFILQ